MKHRAQDRTDMLIHALYMIAIISLFAGCGGLVVLMWGWMK